MNLCRRRVARNSDNPIPDHVGSNNNDINFWNNPNNSSADQGSTSSPVKTIAHTNVLSHHKQRDAITDLIGQHRHGAGLEAESIDSIIAANSQFQSQQSPKKSTQKHRDHFDIHCVAKKTENPNTSRVTSFQQETTRQSLLRPVQLFHDPNQTELNEAGTSMVLVSKASLSDLSNQVAFSMNKMKDLEDQVRLIPELQRRLDDVINDTTSLKGYPHNNERDLECSNVGGNKLITINNSSVTRYYNNSNNSENRSRDCNTNSGSLSLRTTPVKMQLDCGCTSFKEHLRYNSIRRELRMNQARSNQLRGCHENKSIPILPSPIVEKVDVAVNTDLTMRDIMARVEVEELLIKLEKLYTIFSALPSTKATTDRNAQGLDSKSTSNESDSVTGTISERKSSSPLDSRSDSYGEVERSCNHFNSTISTHKGSISESSRKNCKNVQQVENDDDDEDDGCTDSCSTPGEEPFSIGSVYQDPSDFEEYCAYGESLERRTKDFVSCNSKIPSDLRFALIKFYDLIKKKKATDDLESTPSCIEIVKRRWFEVVVSKDSQASEIKLYIDYMESLTKQLVHLVVNLTDDAGNTAIHYAASHSKFDIIQVLLDTRVCEVNCINKAGYTPIMLLALADLIGHEEVDVAKQLFSIGDVNIKARLSGQTALMLAASHGRVKTSKLLLESGADPSLQDNDGSTALMCGSESGNEELIRCLLAHKLTDPFVTDNDGLDAQAIARSNGHKNISVILYYAKNVPRPLKPQTFSRNSLASSTRDYFGASLQKSRIKSDTNFVKRASSFKLP